MSSRPSPITQSLDLLQAKVEAAADRAGVPAHERLDMASTVAALPWPERKRLRLVFQGVKAQTQSPTVRAVVDRLLALMPRPG